MAFRVREGAFWINSLCRVCACSGTLPSSRSRWLRQVEIRANVIHFCFIMSGYLRTITGAGARMEGVNKPELLPKEYTPVIDVAGFLTPGEVRDADATRGGV